MTIHQSGESTRVNPLRLWPGVVAVTLQWLLWFVLPVVYPDGALFGMMGGVLAGALILIWWLFFSKAPWSERIGALVLMAAAIYATSFVVDPSISNGLMGRMLYVFSIPPLCLALVAWAVISGNYSIGLRRAALVVAVLLACSAFTLIRTGGITGEVDSDLHWRWTPTPEERLLAEAGEEPVAPPPAPTAAPATPAPAVATPAATATPEKPAPSKAPIEPATPAAAAAANEAPKKRDVAPAVAEAAATESAGMTARAEWPGFRGPDRDDVVRGVQIETDWARAKPVEMWRRKIGPGWSSFAVQGDLIYTQEQRGDDEDVSCYKLSTGELVWRHRDAARFYESNGGAGPRATPTLDNGRVYTFGATGILNALDARTGAVLWSRNAATDTAVETPGWGFAGSPVVVNDVVIAAASGRLAGYDASTGKQRWLGPEGGGGYSSPHVVTIDGVPQVMLLRGSRTISVAPADGTLLWEHRWQPSVSIVQPAVAPDGDVLVTIADGMGGIAMRRLAVARGSTGWTVKERWTSNGLKPYFNDFVVHAGHAYGFDGSILACIDLKDGTRKWKGGRYGHGQILLLSDQDLMLVLSEEGELALVKATPDQFTEIARVPAIEGKTWNHPVLVGDTLLVRNGEEMAAFKLALAAPSRTR